MSRRTGDRRATPTGGRAHSVSRACAGAANSVYCAAWGKEKDTLQPVLRFRHMRWRASTSRHHKMQDKSSVYKALAEAVAAERAGQAHGAAGKALKAAAAELRARTMADERRGDRIAARLSAGVDTLVKALYEANFGAGAPRLAVCAVGGFGRRALAPYSDVDLLFLHDPVMDGALEEVLNPLLYPLWDSGLKLGYAAHTSKSAIALVKEDMTARTAYLDARFICGARPVYEDFAQAYDKLRRRTPAAFVAAKLEEQDARQAKAFETRYLVEPDVKEGKGGLRDLQTIGWIYKYVYGGDIGDNAEIDRVLDVKERRALKKTGRFLWSVRVHLHDLRGRADERLTFDIQPEVAARLGYADRADMSAAERLMKHYFVNTVEVGRLTRILCARLEEERAKGRPRLPKRLPRALETDEARGRPNLRIRHGRLDFESAAKARRTPRDFFRLFRAYGKNPDYDFHPDALAIVSEETPKVTSDVRKDPAVAALFKGVLTQSKDPMRVLRIMTETGLLGKYVPAFGAIVGRIDYGLYRRFTLDEHVLRSIDMLTRIRRGKEKREHRITTQIASQADDPFPLYLAVLLHESAWTVKDRSTDASEKLVQRIARRLGLTRADAVLVAFAATRYGALVRTAARRNLADPRAVAAFARTVGERARLDLMLVVAVCHLRVVGPLSWDDITRRQLAALHQGTAVWLEGGDAALARRLKKRADAARAQVVRRLGDWEEAAQDAALARLSDDMLVTLGPDRVVRFARLAQAAEADGVASAVMVSPRDGDLEAIIYADDRPGLLADLAGVIAGAGLDVRAVRALAAGDGKIVDIFIVQSPDGAAPLDDGDTARRLHAGLLAAAKAPPAAGPVLKRRIGDRRGLFSVKPEVRIVDDDLEDVAIVEAEGLNRPGLLYELASALSQCGVAIASAHIATYGERAVDAFYLQTADHRDAIDRETLARVEKRLLETLDGGSAG